MPTQFARIFRRTGARNILRHFGELEKLGYYDRDGSAVREITGTVERGPISIVTETGDVGVYSFVIRVLDDSRLGISATEIDTGGDEIEVALQEGETTQKKRSIVRVIDASNGLVRFATQ